MHTDPLDTDTVIQFETTFEPLFEPLNSEISRNGPPSHVINHLVSDNGHRLRVPIGHGWLEGRLFGRLELSTEWGELEIVPCAPEDLPEQVAVLSMPDRAINRFH